MQQVTLAFENDESTPHGPPIEAGRERQLVELMAQAIVAVLDYRYVDPANRLVAEVLEQRWNEKLEALTKLKTELDSEELAPQPLSRAEQEAIIALGENFASVWNDPACPMVLKKQIARTLINEIIVDLDDDTQQLHFIIHWQGGCHTHFDMPKPLSGALLHKTALEDVELISKMAHRYRDDGIARVLSKLGRRTGKGNRWTQSPVASVRPAQPLRAPEGADPRQGHHPRESIQAFIQGLELPEAEKARLLQLTPGNYTGKAEELARKI